MPETALRCRDGRRCDSDACKKTCDYCIHCRSDASTRTCVYSDIYYDGHANEFLVKTDAPNAFKTPGCRPALGLGVGAFPVKYVRKLPGPVSAVFTAPVLVAGPLHGAFAHGFLEGLLAAFLLRAEQRAQWGGGGAPGGNDTQTPWTLFFDRPQLRHWRENFGRAFHPCNGRPRGHGWHLVWYGRVLDARGALYRGAPTLRKRLVRFRSLAVSGLGGRSPWNGFSYSSSRPFGGSDLEFSRREHSTATLHFFGKLAAGFPAPATAPLRRIVVLNRESNFGRALSNPADVAQALRSAFPDHEVLVTTPAKVPDYPRGLVALMQSASVLASPHGAQLAHVGFMPLGAGVVDQGMRLERRPARRCEEAKEQPNVRVHSTLRGPRLRRPPRRLRQRLRLPRMQAQRPFGRRRRLGPQSPRKCREVRRVAQ